MASSIILCTSGLNFFTSTASLWVNCMFGAISITLIWNPSCFAVKASTQSVVIFILFSHKTALLLNKSSVIEMISSRYSSLKIIIIIILWVFHSQIPNLACTTNRDMFGTSVLSSRAALPHCINSPNTCHFTSSAAFSLHLPTTFADKGMHFSLPMDWFLRVISSFLPKEGRTSIPWWCVAFKLSRLSKIISKEASKYLSWRIRTLCKEPRENT